MYYVSLLKFRQGSNVCSRIGNVDGKEIVLLEVVGLPDYYTLPYELPDVSPRLFQWYHSNLIGLFVAYQHLGFYTLPFQRFH